VIRQRLAPRGEGEREKKLDHDLYALRRVNIAKFLVLRGRDAQRGMTLIELSEPGPSKRGETTLRGVIRFSRKGGEGSEIPFSSDVLRITRIPGQNQIRLLTATADLSERGKGVAQHSASCGGGGIKKKKTKGHEVDLFFL